jgi:hypothetical protein
VLLLEVDERIRFFFIPQLFESLNALDWNEELLPDA